MSKKLQQALVKAGEPVLYISGTSFGCSSLESNQTFKPVEH